MARYKYLGESEVDVPDLAGTVTWREQPGKPIQPGEQFETDLEINNPIFVLVVAPAAPVAAEPPTPSSPPAAEEAE